MRSIYVSLVSVLSLALIQAPNVSSVAGARSTPIGTVLRATRSTVEIDTRYEGATIFDGETLTTDDSSVLRIQLGGPQMVMRSNSVVAEVRGIENGFSAKLKGGTVVISTKQSQKFRVFADGTTIQPLGEAPTIARITRVSPNEIVLTSEKGSLVISMGNEVKTVDPGNSYHVEIHSESEPNPAEPQFRPRAPGRSHFTMFLVVAVPVVMGIFVWRALVSPPKP
jgi:hypothetical protein